MFVLERFYGDKCVNYRASKETIAKTCKHIQKTRDLGILCEKMQLTVQNVVEEYAQMFKKPAVVYVNYSLLIWSSWSTPPLAPVTDQNKPAVWAATPREAG